MGGSRVTGIITGPYGHAARLYRESGWLGVLPIVGKQEGLPGGFTGREGTWPEDEQIETWLVTRGNDNICLRLPPDVIGIDVDAYGGRRGLETLEWWEQNLGPLPPTWSSTSRSDGSRIMFFRVPTGVAWASDLGRGTNVEIIRYEHRYAVVWPSVHPDTSGRYGWRTPEGVGVERVPHVDELPALPVEWVHGLTRRSGSAGAGGGTGPGAPGRPGGDGAPGGRGDHGREDVDVTDVDGNRVDPDRILQEGVPPGEQQVELFRYLCSLRARGLRRSEMITLALVVIQRFENEPGREPWTPDDAVRLVDRVRREYAPGTTTLAGIGPGALAWARRVAGLDGAGDGGAAGTVGPDGRIVVDVNEPPPREPLATDLGNTLRVVRVLGDRLRYAADVGRWYVWDGRRWEPDRRNRALELTKEVIDSIRASALLAEGDERQRWLDWATRSESIAARRAMLAGAEAEVDLVVTADQFDRDPDVLVVRNGTLDLRTGELRESRHADLCSRLAEVTYDPAATAERWLGHVELLCAGDPVLAAYVRRAAGYSLTGDVGARSFFFLEGTGSNGKNAFIEPLMLMLGSYAQAASTALLTGGDEQHPTIMADLLGTRLVFVDETRQGKALNVERIKALTGSKRVKARRMREDFFEFDARFKLWIAGNGQPTIKDPSDGIWNRMHRVVCRGKVDPARRIDRFGDLLYAEEASGILNWALQGLLDWRQLGSLGVPESVKADVQEYRDDEDYVGQFIDDRLVRCDPGEGEFTPTSLIFTAYQLWAAEHGIKGANLLDASQLGKQLVGHGLRRPDIGMMYTFANGDRKKVRGFKDVRVAGHGGPPTAG